MRLIPKSSGKEPGTWRYGPDEGEAYLVCPGCGFDSLLNHEIGPDGTVSPSVACPITTCSFHDWICLDGWGE